MAVIRPTVLELFTGIPEADRRRIARFCSGRRYVEGAAIFSEGDPAEAMFIVEDGLVKRDFKANQAQGIYRLVTKKPIVPSPEEIAANHRARSAKLRIAQRN